MINWNIYIIECLSMIVIFTAMIMIPLCKNSIWWIHDYPKDIQEEYFKTHERIPTEPFSVTVMLKNPDKFVSIMTGTNLPSLI